MYVLLQKLLSHVRHVSWTESPEAVPIAETSDISVGVVFNTTLTSGTF